MTSQRCHFAGGLVIKKQSPEFQKRPLNPYRNNYSKSKYQDFMKGFLSLNKQSSRARDQVWVNLRNTARQSTSPKNGRVELNKAEAQIRTGPAKGHAWLHGPCGSPKITLSLATTQVTSTIFIGSGFRSHNRELDIFRVWYQIADTKNHTMDTKSLTRPQTYVTSAPAKVQRSTSSRSCQESRASCLQTKCSHKSTCTNQVRTSVRVNFIVNLSDFFFFLSSLSCNSWVRLLSYSLTDSIEKLC